MAKIEVKADDRWKAQRRANTLNGEVACLQTSVRIADAELTRV